MLLTITSPIPRVHPCPSLLSSASAGPCCFPLPLYKMDNPVPPQKPRWVVRWFSPLRWRFWILLLGVPGVLFAAILILMTWPGLAFDWTLSESLFFRRDGNVAALRVGAFRIWILAPYRALCGGCRRGLSSCAFRLSLPQHAQKPKWPLECL